MPDLANRLGSGWAEVERDVLGEFFLRTYPETAVQGRVAAAAAGGWGWDRYLLLQGPQGERIFAAMIAWDTEADALKFLDVALAPVADISEKAYVGAQGDRVLLIVAPTDALVDAVRSQLPGF